MYVTIKAKGLGLSVGRIKFGIPRKYLRMRFAPLSTDVDLHKYVLQPPRHNM